MDSYLEVIVMFRTMESSTFMVLIISLLIGSAYFLRQLIHAVRQRRLMQDTPSSKIRSASQGFVEIAGSAKALDGTLRSPGRKQPCVWYRYRVEDLGPQGHRHSRTLNLGTEFDRISRLFRDNPINDYRIGGQVDESVFSFYIDDGTGQCSVDPAAGTIRAKRKDIWRYGVYRYTEERIAEGDQLYCLGEFKTIQGISRQKAIKETARATLNTWKQDKIIMQQFDTDRDGEIDIEEWQGAREKALDIARQEVAEDYERRQHHELIKPFDRRLPYIISAFPETNLARQYLYQIAYSLPGFLLCGAATTMMLFSLTL